MKAVKIIPPTYFYLSILLMVVLHFALPVTLVLGRPFRLLGLVPAATGAAMAVIADRSFKKAGTSVEPLGETTAFITTGMFRISRHPMYLGFVLFLLGVAMLLGSLTPFIVTAAFAILMEVVFVRFEERKMEGQFGEAWRKYKHRVRRWI